MRWGFIGALASLWGARAAAADTGSAADFYVRDLPGVSPTAVLPEMHAGLLEVGSKIGLGEASLFFWHVRATNDTKKTIVWFNGGPGCSSMDGNLLEIGPLRFDEKTGLLTTSHGAWSESANLLFIDQPFGTGYSEPNTGEYAKTLDIAADAVVQFLSEYADIFPEIAATDIYLAGESYAGQYIPYIYRALSQRVEVMDKLGGEIAGLILGNPWIDPAHQYLSYVPFLKKSGLVPQSVFEDLDRMQTRCIDDLQEKIVINSDVCEIISHFALKMSNERRGSCFNIYKYTLSSPFPDCGMEWPPTVPTLTDWLSRSDVRKALHGPSDNSGRWSECSSSVSKHLDTRSATPSITFLPEILHKVPVFLMIGDLDYVCNADGLDIMVKNMVWNSQSAGFSVEETPIPLPFGTIQSGRNLTVAHVTTGSHMLPVDNLQVSKNLMMHFTGILPLTSNSTSSVDDDNSETPEESGPEKSGPSQEEIDDAVNRAYKKAGIIALVTVLIILLILLCVWWRRGEGLSGKGLVQALLQTSTRFKDQPTKKQYFPLQNLGRRPDVIIEEEEEDFV